VLRSRISRPFGARHVEKATTFRFVA
jgi:hypothetical protein